MKNIYLFLLTTVVLTSCSSRKMLVKREITTIDTTIKVAPKTISSNLNFKVKDTIITDKLSGYKITFKNIKVRDTVTHEDVDSNTVTVDAPEQIVPVKAKKIVEDFKDLSLEKAKLRNETTQNKDSLNYNYKKEALKYPAKLSWFGRIEQSITNYIVGIVILVVVIACVYFFIIKKFI